MPFMGIAYKRQQEVCLRTYHIEMQEEPAYVWMRMDGCGFGGFFKRNTGIFFFDVL